jgi:hypothetical protein
MVGKATWPLIAILLLACTSPLGGASPTPDLGAEYLKLAAPTNAAIDQLQAALEVQPLNGPGIRAATKALFDAEVKFNMDLFGFEKKVPANVKTHVEAVRNGLSKQIVDLKVAIASTDDVGLTNALLVWVTNAQADSSAFVLLRSDLGLPPASHDSPKPTPSP